MTTYRDLECRMIGLTEYLKRQVIYASLSIDGVLSADVQEYKMLKWPLKKPEHLCVITLAS
jgi:hypothetical protein